MISGERHNDRILKDLRLRPVVPVMWWFVAPPCNRVTVKEIHA